VAVSEPGTNALGGPDGTGGPHVFVDDLDVLDLDDRDRHHLASVLRLRPGDPLTASDGRGRWRRCRFGPTIEPAGEVRVEQRRLPELAIGFVPVKGDRPEWVVQKATEVGVDRLVVLRSERSVVRWDGDRAVQQVARLERVAREAAMQCRRCHLPVVEGVVPVASLAGTAGVVRAQSGGGAPSLEHRLVLVGPEGGWSPAEAEAFPRTVGLGDHVLRSETAVVVAATRYATLRAESGRMTTGVTEGD
jgi:16S rRNA (uracil1498-N3)-methyltransferase